MRPSLTFSSIFNTGTCTVASGVRTCPSGFTAVVTSGYSVSGLLCECLQLKPVRWGGSP